MAQLGARMHYAVPALLERAGMLGHFYTDSYMGRGSAWYVLALAANLVPQGWRPQSLRRLLSRRKDTLPPGKVTAFNLFGLSYVLAQKRAGNAGELKNAGSRYGRRFCELISWKGFKDVNGIYTFESAALPLFLRAGKLGITKILEKYSAPLSLDYELVSEEHRLWAGWEPPYPSRAVFQERIDCDQAEWDAADAIICPSGFVADGMISLGVPPEKLYQVPYGVETATFAVRREPWDGRRPLRLLFLGGISLRKGAQYVYKAVKNLGGRQVVCRMVGPVSIREPYRELLRTQAELTGQIARSEVRRHYEWADLFVFPSICEGSATVVYEALSAGLPVITTPNAGSVVRDGVDGFIVPIRDAEALAAKIELLATAPELLAHLARNARERAAEFTWEKYGERLTQALNKICRYEQFMEVSN